MDYQQPQKSGYGKGYGKRPLWQWIVIYIIVGGIVYGGIYYFVYAKNGGYNSKGVNYNYNYNTNAYVNTNSYNNANIYTNTSGVSTNTSTNPLNY